MHCSYGRPCSRGAWAPYWRALPWQSMQSRQAQRARPAASAVLGDAPVLRGAVLRGGARLRRPAGAHALACAGARAPPAGRPDGCATLWAVRRSVLLFQHKSPLGGCCGPQARLCSGGLHASAVSAVRLMDCDQKEQREAVRPPERCWVFSSLIARAACRMHQLRLQAAAQQHDQAEQPPAVYHRCYCAG